MDNPIEASEKKEQPQESAKEFCKITVAFPMLNLRQATELYGIITSRLADVPMAQVTFTIATLPGGLIPKSKVE